MDPFAVPASSAKATHLAAAGKECVLGFESEGGCDVVRLARVPMPLMAVLEQFAAEAGAWPASACEAHTSPWEKYLFHDLRLGRVPGGPAPVQALTTACDRVARALDELDAALP